MAYIEFTGPMGSGKSTAARAALRQYPGFGQGRRSLMQPRAPLCVNRLGLPPEGPRMWLVVLLGLPRDLFVAVRFWLDTRSWKVSRQVPFYLAKSRALAASPRRWVVDHGLQKHIQGAYARRRLTVAEARHWKELFLQPPWGPERLVEMTPAYEQYVEQLRGSKRHMRRCSHNPESYARRYIELTETLNQPPQDRAPTS